MTGLRIGVDLDGTLADLSSAYREIEQALFGTRPEGDPVDLSPGAIELTEKERLHAVRQRTGRQDAVWRAIKEIPDFWTTLKPLEQDVIRRLSQSAVAHRWEVFFLTQRPQTAGLTAQLQTQRWLVAQGFEMPSVLTLNGSRGKAAHALDLDFLIDDLAKNCVDVVSDSKCQPILVLRKPDPESLAAARGIKIGVVSSVDEAIGMLTRPALESRAGAIRSVLKLLGISK